MTFGGRRDATFGGRRVATFGGRRDATFRGRRVASWLVKRYKLNLRLKARHTILDIEVKYFVRIFILSLVRLELSRVSCKAVRVGVRKPTHQTDSRIRPWRQSIQPRS